MTNPDVAENPEAEGQEDQASFANDCIDLLCKQEKTLWLLGEKEEKADCDESLELTWQMLIDFLDFAETHFDKEEFGEIAGPLHRVHEHTAEHKQKLQTRSWRFVQRLFGKEIPTDLAMSDSYRELGKDYAELFETFFTVCSRRFIEDNEDKERFLQSIDVFQSELQTKW